MLERVFFLGRDFANLARLELLHREGGTLGARERTSVSRDSVVGMRTQMVFHRCLVHGVACCLGIALRARFLQDILFGSNRLRH